MHEYNGVVTILARHRRRKAEHIFCFCRPGYSFKADSRQVVALVHDKMPIIFDQVRHLAFPDQALNERHIDNTGRPFLPAANNANAIGVDIEERAEPRNPLIQQLLAMHQDQRISGPFRDEFSRNHGLPEGRCRRQHTGVVRHQGGYCLLLLERKGSKKATANSHSIPTLVSKLDPNSVRGQQINRRIKTPTRKCNATGTGDSAAR